MKRFLEIENNIKHFIEEYNRNYNKRAITLRKPNGNNSEQELDSSTFANETPTLYQTAILNNFNENYDTYEESVCLANVKKKGSLSQHFSSVLSDLDKLNIKNRSMSFSSINSNLVNNKVEIKQDSDPPNLKLSNRKYKSESDLLDILHNRNYKYYLDEVSLDNHSYFTEYESELSDSDEMWLKGESICLNKDKNKNSTEPKLKFDESSNHLNNINIDFSNKKQSEKLNKDNNNNFSFKKLVHTSLSTVEEFFSTLSDSATNASADLFSSNSTLKSRVFHDKSSSPSSSCSLNNSKNFTTPKSPVIPTISSVISYYLEDYIGMNYDDMSNCDVISMKKQSVDEEVKCLKNELKPYLNTEG